MSDCGHEIKMKYRKYTSPMSTKSGSRQNCQESILHGQAFGGWWRCPNIFEDIHVQPSIATAVVTQQLQSSPHPQGGAQERHGNLEWQITRRGEINVPGGANLAEHIFIYQIFHYIYIYIIYIYQKKAEILVSSQSEGDAFNANGTDPSRERPSRTGSQCSSISSSPHIRSARSSYLWTVSSVATSAISTMFSMKTCGNVGVGSWTSSMKTWPHGHMAKQRWFIFPYLPQDVFPSAASFMLYPGMLMPWKRGSLGACTSDGSRPWGKVLPAAPATGGCSIIAPMISSDWWNILVTGKFSMGNPWKSRLSGRLSHFCRFSEPIWGSNFWRSHGIGKPAVSGAKSSPNPLGSSKNSLSRLSQHGTCPIKGCSRNLFFMTF